DLVMPGPKGPWGEQLVEAVRAGTVAESDIDDKVARLLTLGRRLGALNGFVGGSGQASPVSPQAALIDPALVREVAARSFVLLKNDRSVLPIAPGSARRVALIGPNAVTPLIQGGGSIQVLPVTRPGISEALSRPPELRVPVEMRAGSDVDVRVEFRPEARFVTMRLGIAPQSDDAALIQEAVAAATAADVAVVIIGSAEGSESEGFDRAGMSLVGSQDELVRRVAAANSNTVVVLNTGMPVLMPWIDDVAAVVQAWMPG